MHLQLRREGANMLTCRGVHGMDTSGLGEKFKRGEVRLEDFGTKKLSITQPGHSPPSLFMMPTPPAPRSSAVEVEEFREEDGGIMAL